MEGIIPANETLTFRATRLCWNKRVKEGQGYVGIDVYCTCDKSACICIHICVSVGKQKVAQHSGYRQNKEILRKVCVGTKNCYNGLSSFVLLAI